MKREEIIDFDKVSDEFLNTFDISNVEPIEAWKKSSTSPFNFIKKYRMLRCMSQTDLANAIGVSRQYYNTIENSARVTNSKFVEKIAKVLKVSPIMLYGYSIFKVFPQEKEEIEFLIDLLKSELEYKNVPTNTLRVMRKEKGWTLEYLSTITNISETNLSFIERGKVKPNSETISKLAKAFDKTNEEIFDILY